MQAPLDFVLNGVLQGEDGDEEEIGLDLIDGYSVRVYKLQCLVRCHGRVQFLFIHRSDHCTDQ